MKRIRNKKGKIVEVQLEKGEQLWLIKHNLKLLRKQALEELTKQAQELDMGYNA